MTRNPGVRVGRLRADERRSIRSGPDWIGGSGLVVRPDRLTSAALAEEFRLATWLEAMVEHERSRRPR
ncbi:MAG: hypothetical protein QOH48_261 [Actinomycetota bacterium]|jgi:hypothetical protein|nr:hypothetical protein [Actinomycetota bacterium]